MHWLLPRCSKLPVQRNHHSANCPADSDTWSKSWNCHRDHSLTGDVFSHRPNKAPHKSAVVPQQTHVRCTRRCRPYMCQRLHIPCTGHLDIRSRPGHTFLLANRVCTCIETFGSGACYPHCRQSTPRSGPPASPPMSSFCRASRYRWLRTLEFHPSMPGCPLHPQHTCACANSKPGPAGPYTSARSPVRTRTTPLFLGLYHCTPVESR